jgi:hypothetical protein
MSGAVIISVLTVASGARDRATTDASAVVISSPQRSPMHLEHDLVDFGIGVGHGDDGTTGADGDPRCA